MEDLILNIVMVVGTLFLFAVGVFEAIRAMLLRNSSEGVGEARFCLLFCWCCAIFYWLSGMGRIEKLFAVTPVPALFSIAFAWGYRKFWQERRQMRR